MFLINANIIILNEIIIINILPIIIYYVSLISHSPIHHISLRVVNEQSITVYINPTISLLVFVVCIVTHYPSIDSTKKDNTFTIIAYHSPILYSIIVTITIPINWVKN